MSGRRNFDELRAKTPERRARVAEYERATRFVLRLAQLRAEQGVTQEELGRLMDVSQANVSQIEHKGDLYLSTINNYVTALGGELHLRVVFPDHREIDLPIAPDDERERVIAVGEG